MRKILHIAESFGGGVFSFLVDLVKKTANDYDVVIAYGKREQTPTNFKQFFPKNVRFIEVKNFTRSIGVKDIKAFFEIKNIVNNEKPDIVHLHSSKAGFLGRLAINTKNIKTLYTPHGFAFLMKNVSPLKKKFYFVAEKFAAIKKATIIGCSKGEYEEALKITKNSICINNGIDVEQLRLLSKNFITKEIDFNNLKICTIGRIGKQKNPKLFNEIAKSFPNLEFTWIGDGEDRNLITSKNVNITGWISKEEVLKILNENDIFVLTSLWEGLPLSLLEAMFFRKICVVSSCIGNKDAIINKKNGFIFENKEEFIKIIEELKNFNLDEIKESEFKCIIETFNLEKMSNEYRKVYNG